MAKIGDLDYGPTTDEDVQTQALRSELGKYTNKAWLDSNQPIAVDVLDYIGQFAATWAIQNQGLYFNFTDRLTSTGWAKSWVTGFVSWYLDPQNSALRDDPAWQPDFLETCYRGCLIRATNNWRNIPWSLGYIKRRDGLWLSNVPESVIERIDMNLKGWTVDSWKSTKLRNGMGWLYLPSVCSKGAQKLELGDEILSDWIDPPDANHGHPLSTMWSLFEQRTGVSASLHSQNVETGRKTYDIIKAGTWRIVVEEKKVPPCVITFFKTR